MDTKKPITDTELDRRLAELPLLDLPEAAAGRQEAAALTVLAQIGRASCREKV